MPSEVQPSDRTYLQVFVAVVVLHHCDSIIPLDASMLTRQSCSRQEAAWSLVAVAALHLGCPAFTEHTCKSKGAAATNKVLHPSTALLANATTPVHAMPLHSLSHSVEKLLASASEPGKHGPVVVAFGKEATLTPCTPGRLQRGVAETCQGPGTQQQRL